MRFGVVTLFPAMIENALDYGVIGRAKSNGLLKLELENPRDWAMDKHRTVDDRPFGGGPGMVMKPEPLERAITAVRQRVGQGAEVIFLSPQGKLFDQNLARDWQGLGELILVAGRYEGVDERIMQDAAHKEVSLGNYVLSGGEFAALAIIDAVTRLEPGVLGDPMSPEEDSFGEDGLLDCPHYTRPEDYNGLRVPAVLLSGDHQAIARWRRQQALVRTWERRPDLLKNAVLSDEDKVFINSLEAQGHRKGT